MNQVVETARPHTRKQESSTLCEPSTVSKECVGATQEIENVLRRYSSPIEYIDHEAFHTPDAEKILVCSTPPEEQFEEILPTGKNEHATLDRLFHHRLLSKPYEKELFLRMNYLRFKAEQLRAAQGGAVPVNGTLHEIESHLAAAKVIADTILRHNMRLVGSFSRRIQNPEDRDDFIGEAWLVLMRVIKKFDVSADNRFSTVATHYLRGLIVQILRSSMRKRRLHKESRCNTPGKGVLDSLIDTRGMVIVATYRQRLRAVIRTLIINTSGRERRMLLARFGLNGEDEKELKEIGGTEGFTKTRAMNILNEVLTNLEAPAIKIIGDAQPDIGDLPPPIDEAEWEEVCAIHPLEEHLPLNNTGKNIAKALSDIHTIVQPMIHAELEDRLPEKADKDTACTDIWIQIGFELVTIINFRIFKLRLQNIVENYIQILERQEVGFETNILTRLQEMKPELADRLQARYIHFETDEEYAQRNGLKKSQAIRKMGIAKEWFQRMSLNMQSDM